MICKDENGQNVEAPKLILKTSDEVRRFYKALQRIEERRNAKSQLKNSVDCKSKEMINNLIENHFVKIEMD